MLPNLNVMLLGGGNSLNVDNVFATVLATGAGLQAAFDALPFVPDLLVAKNRDAAAAWTWRDTDRGLGFTVASDGTAAQTAFPGYSGTTNHVGYGVKRAPKVLDIVTYTGNGVAGRQLVHALGIKPGMIKVKRLDTAVDWGIGHQAQTFAYGARFDIAGFTLAKGASFWNSTEPTDQLFTLGSASETNANGGSYVALLFAHDPSASGVIQCGQYVGNGSATGPIVSLGWEPQWVEVKNTSASQNWVVLDAERSAANPRNAQVSFNQTGAETATAGSLNFLSNGFQPATANAAVNSSGVTYAYAAFRKGAP